ncbi:alpha/beta hydrolase domain-containing protein, partial [Spirillospora sp. NPDC046719]
APGAALLFGSTRPFDGATLRRLYPRGAGDYLPAFRAAAERAVAAGFLLAADLDEIVAVAAASFPS